MDNNSHLASGSPYSRESALLQRVGVAVNPNVAAGLLLGYFFLGLSSYIWAFLSQRSRLNDFFQSRSFLGHNSRLRGVQNINNFVRSMIMFDAMNGVSAVIMAFELFLSVCSSPSACYTVYFMWFKTRYFGLLLHLFTTLACLFCLCHPQRAAKWRRIFTLLYILVLVFVVVCVVTDLLQPSSEMILGMGAVMFGLALAIVTKCAVSTAPPSTAIHKKPVVIIAVVTVLFTYTPAFVLYCLLLSSTSTELTDKYFVLHANVLFCTNFHVFMDGLLCYFILRMPVEEAEEQEPAQSPTFV